MLLKYTYITAKKVMLRIFFTHRKKPQTDYNNPSPARRSRQAKARVAKMRKMFGLDSPKQVSTNHLSIKGEVFMEKENRGLVILTE